MPIDFFQTTSPSGEFDLSVVVPCYNEHKRIPMTLFDIRNYVIEKNILTQLIVVNDGSIDETLEVLKNFQNLVPQLNIVSYDQNQGKGFAVRAGVEKADGKHVLIMDADSSTPIEELDHFLKKIDNYDVIIGSRYLPGSDVIRSQPFYRRVISRLGNILIRCILGLSICDTQCGFKLFKKDAVKEIFQYVESKRYGYDVEILLIAKKFGYTILEEPVSWVNRPDSRINPYLDVFHTLGEVLKAKWRHFDIKIR